ncbi:MAG: 3-isopropylmalate dehydrogenase [Porphyrobacter sp.]|nr:3-isopropylmalate dehydrogenase [Porphyrobacter sp.]
MKTLLLLPGDGIGPEIIAEAARVIDRLRADAGLELVTETALFGGCAYEAEGLPLSDDTLARARAADAVLMGAVGGPQWAGVAYDKRPEAGLLRLRAELDVFTNLRPAYCYPALADASTLKREVIEGLDMMIVRELTGGVYFGKPRGIETLENGERRGVNTHVYTSSEITRVARIAFAIARERKGVLWSAEKANVMEAGLLWREEVTRLGAEAYPEVALHHILADNCAMQLVKNPKQFDVILTDNLFGDILSDIMAMLTGSLGMLPSAALGEEGTPGIYEPIHGSAPDIAGQGIANPCAAILSLAMALRLQLGRPDCAERIERAIGQALADGYRTPDLLAGEGCTRVGTTGMGEAILERL